MTDTDKEVYLICKHGAYYKSNCQGYTPDPIIAGRYTLKDAEQITHPNGPDGPRDGMFYVHEDTLEEEGWLAYKSIAAERDHLKARVEELEKVLEAASVLATRAEAVFSSEYVNTRHIEGAKEYFARNCEALGTFRAALKNKDASDD